MAGIAGTPGASIPTGSPTSRPSYTINPAHVRTLLWLRWKLTLRGYTRSWQRIVGLVFSILFILPAAFGLAYASVWAYTSLSHAAATQILCGVLALLYIGWAALPLLQYTLNEGLDVTKLQIYPLTRGEQMVSLVLATFFDFTTIIIVVLYVAVFIGWHASPLAAAVTVVALLAAYIHTVGFSQLILAALMGLLRTRRFRDLTVIVFALFGSACSLGSQLVARSFILSDPASIERVDLATYLRWTPPGMAAQAIALANSGNILLALPWLLGSIILVPVLLWIWAVVLERGITSAESAGSDSRRRVRRPRPTLAVSHAANGSAIHALPAAQPARRGWRPLSPVALAITQKDARYLWRDPQLKAALLSTLLATIFLLVPRFYAGTDAASSSRFNNGPLSIFLGVFPALLVILTFSLNSLGMDRAGLQMLFLFPVRPLDILFGKNLFTGSLSFVILVALTCARAALGSGWDYVPLAIAVGTAAIFVMLACGNVTSVISPFRMRQMRTGDTSTIAQENGCLRSIIAVATLVITAILLIPVAIAVIIPFGIERQQWLIYTVPVALIYGISLYQFATRLIAPVLLKRGPEILAATTREA
ncbi:MAG: hypothetical protein ACXWP6_01255 [Ktedonobacterales bacterium]